MSASSAQSKVKTRAYTIVWFRGADDQVKLLSGRERAFHVKALSELKLNRHAITAISSGRFDFGKNNLNGVLLIGRTALPGGRANGDESALDAAVRELHEEFGLLVDDSQLCEVGRFGVGDNVFFSVEIDETRANECVASHAANSEKRSLEIVALEDMEGLLRAPDESDQSYIAQEMATVAESIARQFNMKHAHAQERLQDVLFRHQLARPQQHHVDAVSEFARRFKPIER